MRLDAFPDGGRLFLDANIFLYHVWGQTPSCSRLLGRIETGLVEGVTSTTVLGEVTHRLLIAEAIARYPQSRRHPTRFLKRHPAIVRTVSQSRLIMEHLTRLPLHVLPVTPALWHQALSITHAIGLLLNDAITVGCLRQLRMPHLASADQDFRLVPDLTLWSP